MNKNIEQTKELTDKELEGVSGGTSWDVLAPFVGLSGLWPAERTRAPKTVEKVAKIR